MTLSKPITKNQRAKLGEDLRLARTGDMRLIWLHKLVIDSGYATAHGRESGSIILVTAKMLGDGFRVQERTIRNWIREGLPVHQYSVGNRPALYDVFDVVRWREKRFEATGESDPLMRGGSSPALERYRAAKANQAERENKKAEGQLVEKPEVNALWTEIASALRTQLEIVKRNYPQCAPDIDEAINLAKARMEKKMGLKARRKNEGRGKANPK